MLQPDGGLKFSLPRGDLNVSVEGIHIMPALALGSWATFTGEPGNAMVMGDLVLTETEVGPVMQVLRHGGINVTALHGHLMGENPRVMYMHIAGRGDAVALAGIIHDALALTGTPAPSMTVTNFDSKGINASRLEAIIGRTGKPSGGVYQFSVPRGERITDGGMEISPSMGTATSINFQPLGNGRTAVAGDMVLLDSEVNPVIDALTDNGISVTALHSHMLEDEPRLFFMHYWGTGDAEKLAAGLRSAIDLTGSRK